MKTGHNAHIRISIPALIVGLLLPVLLVGCGRQPRTVQVLMSGAQFKPMTVTIPRGGAVTWYNNDQTAHTSTTDGFKMGGPNPPWMWNSKPMSPGQSFTHQFTRAGTYHYHCMVHPYMKGTVVVK